MEKIRQIRMQLALFSFLVIPVSTLAAPPPTVKEMLEFKPAQRFVDYDTAPADRIGSLKVDLVVEGKGKVWVLRDVSGKIYRRFLDTNRDNIVDQWMYYRDGVEVYRDIDSNFTGRADQFRWVNAGGTRWGFDTNKDGKIDTYRVISAEEATREVVRALVLKDFSVLEPTLLRPADASALGTYASADRIKELNSHAREQFNTLVSKLPQLTVDSRWVRFEGDIPILIPGDALDGSRDVQIYRDSIAVIQTGDKIEILQFSEIVLVGRAWKVLDIPSLVAPNSPLANRTNTIFTNVAPAAELAEGQPAADLTQGLFGQLQKLDEEAAKAGTENATSARYHIQRADIILKLADNSKSAEERADWQRQQADSLIAALQMVSSQDVMDRLNRLLESIGQHEEDTGLLGYIAFRQISADYARKVQMAGSDFAAVQQEWLEGLDKFVTDFPTAEDTSEALSQLAVGMEFTGKEDQARRYYQKLTESFPNSPAAQRGQGALRRLDLVGKPLVLKTSDLRRGTIDIQKFQGKVILVDYWATTCNPWKDDLPRLKELYAKFHSKGFEIIGICLDNDKSDVAKFVQSAGLVWPIGFEAGGLDSPAAVQYGILALPSQFLVDVKGNVVSRSVNISQLEEELKKLLK